MTFNNKSNIDYDYLFKILIIGDSGVGKTTILQRFAQNYFSHEYVATIGVDFQLRTLDIDSKRCKLQVCDIGAQDRFKYIVSSFYRNSHGVIICFDITDLESFRNIKSWFDDVKRYCSEETQIIIVGTKSDLKTRRMVSHEMIKAYVEKNQLLYLETSSKTNENIEKCFFDFTRTLIECTTQIELDRKINPIDLNNKRKPVNSTTNSGCYGGNKCTI